MSIGPEAVLRGRASGAVSVTLEGNVLQRLTVTDEPLTIGRLPSNRLVLPHPSVSRHHAELRVESGTPVLVDVGSAGGTFVDGLRLLANNPVALDAVRRIGIGPYVLDFEPLAMPEPAAAAVPLARATPMPDAEAEPDRTARPTFAAPRPDAGPSRYLAHLPTLLHESDFLGRMLLIYEAIWEPLEQRQDHLPLYFGAATAPAPMLGFLADWLSIELNPHWPERRRRELLAEAMELYRWRGTAYGLARLVEVCTGVPITITEAPDEPFVFRASVKLPAATTVRREFIESLLESHKPAHVGYVLEVSS